MTASEFAFLALGLMLGVATGAALVEVIRSRPPAPREVRVTVTPDSVPRRSSTLSTSVSPAMLGPARGGPGDRRGVDRDADDDPFVGIPAPGVAAAGPPSAATTTAGPAPAASAAAGAGGPISRTPVPSGSGPRPLVGIAIEPEPDHLLASLRPAPVAAAMMAAGAMPTALGEDGSLRPTMRDTPAAAPAAGAVAGAAHATAGQGDGPGGAPGDGGPGEGAAEGAAEVAADPCAAQRRIAEERCAVADRLVAQAETAAASLREAQRQYDDHQTRASGATETADPRALRAAKETAQAAFRAASAVAHSQEAIEGAARTWLQEINRINQTAREAILALRREQEAVNRLVPVIERLSVEADAARINAEAAQEACLAARTATAECEEALALGAAAVVATAPLASPDAPRAPAPPEGPRGIEEAGALAAASLGEAEPLIFRLLRGERAALQRLVAHLAGEDPAERRRWQLQLIDLIDAILARAIEATSLDFPSGHQFWGEFTREQSREIVGALASLGYRFDGLGGFTDGRIPSQRDLSLAVGFAGLDPMRIRHWPSEAEMADLLRDVTVTADEYVAGAAGSLTLGEMVSMLGRRADGLTDLWNAWGRVRPLLIASE